MLRLAIAAVAAALLLPAAEASASQARPTIVFVHGAFADASGFGAVTDRLQDRGYTVVSPANPLRGPASDAAYVASVMKTIDGPIVLVAHSYGGAVSSEAATHAGNVKALVYLNALALEAGESNLGITQRFPNRFGETLRPRPFPLPDGTQGTDLYVDPAAFRSVFAPDVGARTAARMASAQRPVSAAAIEEPSTAPAWKTIPSWYLIGRQDDVISPAAQRFMAKRARRTPSRSTRRTRPTSRTPRRSPSSSCAPRGTCAADDSDLRALMPAGRSADAVRDDRSRTPTARGGISTVLRSVGERTEHPARPPGAGSQTADTMSGAGELVRAGRPAYGAHRHGPAHGRRDARHAARRPRLTSAVSADIRAAARLDAALPASSPSLRRVLASLAALGLVACAVPLAVAIRSVGGHHRDLIAVFGPVIGGASIFTGLRAWQRRPENRFGALLVAVGFTYCLSGLIVTTDSWPFIAGLALIALPYAILFHILLAFPSGRLDDAVRDRARGAHVRDGDASSGGRAW